MESPKRGRRSNTLKVAMPFPTRQAGKKRPASESVAQVKAESEEEGEEENFVLKRALNIKENKAMVSLSSVSLLPDLSAFIFFCVVSFMTSIVSACKAHGGDQ